jgi:hypothetical protein
MMKVSPMIYFALAIGVLGYVVAIASTREKFVAEFIDTKQEGRTNDLADSSYSQRTNHFVPAPFPMGPIEGVQSPFQVNQYKAFIA